MSTAQPTLIRYWKNGYQSEPITTFVDNWLDAEKRWMADAA